MGSGGAVVLARSFSPTLRISFCIKASWASCYEPGPSTLPVRLMERLWAEAANLRRDPHRGPVRNTAENHTQTGGCFLLKHLSSSQWMSMNITAQGTPPRGVSRGTRERRGSSGAGGGPGASPSSPRAHSAPLWTAWSEAGARPGEELPSPGDIAQGSWSAALRREDCLPTWPQELSLRPAWDTLPSTLNPIHPLLMLQLILEGLLEASHLQFLQNIRSMEWNLDL